MLGQLAPRQGDARVRGRGGAPRAGLRDEACVTQVKVRVRVRVRVRLRIRVRVRVVALELAGEHRREDEDEDVAQYLPYISPISRLYLACISPTSYRREDEDEDVAQDDEHREEDLHEGDIGET